MLNSHPDSAKVQATNLDETHKQALKSLEFRKAPALGAGC